MKERLKTIFLTVLVAASLVQTYMLAMSSPDFDTIVPAPAGYVETELKGTRLEMEATVFPGDLVLHFENGEHTVLYPQMTFYNMIMDVVQQRAFDGVSATAFPPIAVSGWTSVGFGLEMRYGAGLPFAVLREVMQFSGENIPDEMTVSRMILYSPDHEAVRVYLVDDHAKTALEATKADLTARDIERFVNFGMALPRYTLVSGTLYVPEEPLAMVRHRIAYTEFTAEQLQRSLFPDPYSIRNLRERDGSQVYTDGKRGLKLSAEQRWMSYSDPGAPVAETMGHVGTVLSAVQFVNRHGGWNGDFQLNNIVQEKNVNHQRSLVFRQYIGTFQGSFPIVSAGSALPFGEIRLTLQNGVVTGYERSLLQLGETIARDKMSLPGGEELLNQLQAYERNGMVQRLFPAYLMSVAEDEAVLTPAWIVQLTDGTYEKLAAGGAS